MGVMAFQRDDIDPGLPQIGECLVIFAHARLGFADKLVLKWLSANGLAAQVETHLEGKLTIVIWKGERIATARELRAIS
jgi:hypothetical protein